MLLASSRLFFVALFICLRFLWCWSTLLLSLSLLFCSWSVCSVISALSALPLNSFWECFFVQPQTHTSLLESYQTYRQGLYPRWPQSPKGPLSSWTAGAQPIFCISNISLNWCLVSNSGYWEVRSELLELLEIHYTQWCNCASKTEFLGRRVFFRRALCHLFSFALGLVCVLLGGFCAVCVLFLHVFLRSLLSSTGQWSVRDDNDLKFSRHLQQFRRWKQGFVIENILPKAQTCQVATLLFWNISPKAKQCKIEHWLLTLSTRLSLTCASCPPRCVHVCPVSCLS